LTALADAGVALPTGWLWEDGGTYSRTTYANLFAAVTAMLTGHICLPPVESSRGTSPIQAAKSRPDLKTEQETRDHPWLGLSEPPRLQ